MLRLFIYNRVIAVRALKKRHSCAEITLDLGDE
jgi:hypothetical protein